MSAANLINFQRLLSFKFSRRSYPRDLCCQLVSVYILDIVEFAFSSFFCCICGTSARTSESADTETNRRLEICQCVKKRKGGKFSLQRLWGKKTKREKAARRPNRSGVEEVWIRFFPFRVRVKDERGRSRLHQRRRQRQRQRRQRRQRCRHDDDDGGSFRSSSILSTTSSSQSHFHVGYQELSRALLGW